MTATLHNSDFVYRMQPTKLTSINSLSFRNEPTFDLFTKHLQQQLLVVHHLSHSRFLDTRETRT
jgi:hypothetical protein